MPENYEKMEAVLNQIVEKLCTEAEAAAEEELKELQKEATLNEKEIKAIFGHFISLYFRGHAMGYAKGAKK